MSLEYLPFKAHVLLGSFGGGGVSVVCQRTAYWVRLKMYARDQEKSGAERAAKTGDAPPPPHRHGAQQPRADPNGERAHKHTKNMFLMRAAIIHTTLFSPCHRLSARLSHTLQRASHTQQHTHTHTTLPNPLSHLPNQNTPGRAAGCGCGGAAAPVDGGKPSSACVSAPCRRRRLLVPARPPRGGPSSASGHPTSATPAAARAAARLAVARAPRHSRQRRRRRSE
jgi:hypothetical protein